MKENILAFYEANKQLVWKFDERDKKLCGALVITHLQKKKNVIP